MQGNETLLHEDPRQITDFEFDDRGRLAFVTRAEGDRYVIYRVGPQGLREALRCVDLQRCSLLAVGECGELQLSTDVDSGYRRLARLDAQGRLQTLHSDPRGEADLDEVVLDPVTRQPLIASYRSTVAANYGLTLDARRQVEAIEEHYPQHNLRIEVGRGPGARWLVHDRAGSMKGQRLHLYDPASGEFRDILDDFGFHSEGKPVAAIPEAALARKIAFSWRASDGMLLHGFLQLPAGVDPARAPLVANVHGGPFNLSRPEFNSASQLLTNRGYVVFEPNFRGSTGHGRDYLLSASGDFGNGRWICPNIVAWLLEEGRVAKPLRQVEERMLIAESTSLAKMAGVLFRLSESSRMSVCPLLFHACQHTTLSCLGMPVGAPGLLVGVFFVGGMDKCQGVVSESVALAGHCFQPIQHDRCEITLVVI